MWSPRHYRGRAVKAMAGRRAGQSALELSILVAALLLVLIAMIRYAQYAVSGRIKQAGSGLSDVLFDPTTSRTEWVTAGQVTSQTTEVVGGIPDLPGQPGLAGASVSTSRTLSGVTMQTDQL